MPQPADVVVLEASKFGKPTSRLGYVDTQWRNSVFDQMIFSGASFPISIRDIHKDKPQHAVDKCTYTFGSPLNGTPEHLSLQCERGLEHVFSDDTKLIDLKMYPQPFRCHQVGHLCGSMDLESIGENVKYRKENIVTDVKRNYKQSLLMKTSRAPSLRKLRILHAYNMKTL